MIFERRRTKLPKSKVSTDVTDKPVIDVVSEPAVKPVVEIQIESHEIQTKSHEIQKESHVEYGVSNLTEYGVSSSLSNTAYSSKEINTVYLLPLDTVMTKVIKGEFEKIKDVEVEDVSLTCDTSLEIFNMEVNRLSRMDNVLFKYNVEIASIPCNSVMDDDLEDETDDDMGYDPSDVAFIEWLRSKIFNYKTMDQYTLKALWIYWIRGDDKVELTDEESSDDEGEIAEVFRINTNIFDYETPICSAFNEFKYLLKDYKWYEALDDCELKEEALRNKAIMDEVINDDESCCELKRKWNIYTNYDDAYEINHEDNRNKELCEIHEPTVECDIANGRIFGCVGVLQLLGGVGYFGERL
ncbi:hypothetical protein Tco_0534052 [Tanacetum coccineum]